MKDLYAVLAIPRNANKQQIVSAFRTLALKYHPDRCQAPNAKELFIEVRQAYEILVDEKKRAVYDQLLVARTASASTSQAQAYAKWSEDARQQGEVHSRMTYAEFESKVLAFAERVGGVVGSVAAGAGLGALEGIYSILLRLLGTAALACPLISLLSSYAANGALFSVNVVLAIAWSAYLLMRWRAMQDASYRVGTRVGRLLRSTPLLLVGFAVYLGFTALNVNAWTTRNATERAERIAAFEATITDLREHLPQYLKAYPRAPVAAMEIPELGRIVVIDMLRSDFDSSFIDLPQGLGAKLDREVDHVLRLWSKKTQVGTYTRGGAAYQWRCGYEVIDYRSGLSVFSETKEGTRPPSAKNYPGDGHGSSPCADLLDRLKSRFLKRQVGSQTAPQ